MEGKTRKKIVRIGVGSIAFIGLLMTGFYLYLIRYPQGIQVPLNKEILVDMKFNNMIVF
jgi:hypothetical protein